MTPAAPPPETPDEIWADPVCDQMGRYEWHKEPAGPRDGGPWEHYTRTASITPKPYTDRERMLAEALKKVTDAASELCKGVYGHDRFSLLRSPLLDALKETNPQYALAAEIMNTQQEKV